MKNKAMTSLSITLGIITGCSISFLILRNLEVLLSALYISVCIALLYGSVFLAVDIYETQKEKRKEKEKW